MSLGRFTKLVLVAVALFVALYLLFAVLYFAAARFWPNIFDSKSIINGYEYLYMDRDAKMIVYSGNERSQAVIIDSRVDEYRVEGDRLIVARRPVEDHLAADGVLHSRLLPNCEFWVIDTKTHKVEKTTNSGGLHCN